MSGMCSVWPWIPTCPWSWHCEVWIDRISLRMCSVLGEWEKYKLLRLEKNIEIQKRRGRGFIGTYLQLQIVLKLWAFPTSLSTGVCPHGIASCIRVNKLRNGIRRKAKSGHHKISKKLFGAPATASVEIKSTLGLDPYALSNSALSRLRFQSWHCIKCAISTGWQRPKELKASCIPQQGFRHAEMLPQSQSPKNWNVSLAIVVILQAL